jgi:hypothetical protein
MTIPALYVDNPKAKYSFYNNHTNVLSHYNNNLTLNLFQITQTLY